MAAPPAAAATTVATKSSAGSLDDSFTWMAPMIATAVWGSFLLPVITKVVNSEDPWKIKEKMKALWYSEQDAAAAADNGTDPEDDSDEIEIPEDEEPIPEEN